MKLESWIQEQGLLKTFVAKEIGVSRVYMSNIITGLHIPSRTIAIKIEEYTKGKVTKEEIMFPKDY